MTILWHYCSCCSIATGMNTSLLDIVAVDICLLTLSTLKKTTENEKHVVSWENKMLPR